MPQRVALPGGSFFQFGEQPVRDGGQLLRAQRVEKHRFIQAAQQFRPEERLGFLHGLAAAAFVLPVGCAESQKAGLAAEAPRPQVGREQDDGVGKIRLAPLGVGQAAVLQNLQQQVLDIAVGLFDLIKQYDAVGAAAHRLGQLAALVVAHIARRRAQQPRHCMPFHIFRHIEAKQCFFAAEPALCQRAGQLGLAHAGGA